MRQCCLNHPVLSWLIFLILYATYSSADILVFSAVARHQIEEEFRDMPAKFGGIIPSEGIKVHSFNFFMIQILLYLYMYIYKLFFLMILLGYGNLCQSSQCMPKDTGST